MTSARSGGGGSKNCSILRTNSTDRLREMRMKGEGSKNPKLLRTSFMYGPLMRRYQGYELLAQCTVGAPGPYSSCHPSNSGEFL